MSRILSLYLVVFAGFVGYSLMIAIFTPLLLGPDGGMLPRRARQQPPPGRSCSVARRALYPLAQFLAAPVIGALPDRHGRKRTVNISLLVSTACMCS